MLYVCGIKCKVMKTKNVKKCFVFTPKNILKNLNRLGAWSTYGLASFALKHYFPKSYTHDVLPQNEVKLLTIIGCKEWREAVVKYHTEIGYTYADLSNTDYVNAY